MIGFARTLGVLAGLVQLAGYYHYDRIMTAGGNKPTSASWFMWAMGGITEVVVFAALVENRAKEFLPFVCAVAAIVVFAKMRWLENRLGIRFSLTTQEKLIVAIDAATLVFYAVTRDPFASNILLGIDLVVSYAPTLEGVRKDPSSEHPMPWAVWTLAAALLGAVIAIEWVSVWELIYPATLFFLNGYVWLKTSRK